jgi:hypothetical protein
MVAFLVGRASLVKVRQAAPQSGTRNDEGEEEHGVQQRGEQLSGEGRGRRGRHLHGERREHVEDLNRQGAHRQATQDRENGRDGSRHAMLEEGRPGREERVRGQETVGERPQLGRDGGDSEGGHGREGQPQRNPFACRRQGRRQRITGGGLARLRCGQRPQVRLRRAPVRDRDSNDGDDGPEHRSDGDDSRAIQELEQPEERKSDRDPDLGRGARSHALAAHRHGLLHRHEDDRRRERIQSPAWRYQAPDLEDGSERSRRERQRRRDPDSTDPVPLPR